ncbi:AraC family transcriptional regulator [Methylobacterium iners]|uniref:HTH-type transcriptional regulator NimR n=1 Tax=Methylobacterium iners TaxID=418707 RepID=A0ABQ4RSE4_9HYPH|nr:helix-turn-helix transcriptional regulator [Methylobacterium iners]GJD93639.1 HTH-type transcriptional regulator NimR [Methylobacterium iners]
MRSTASEDYQRVPRPVAVMPKAFRAGSDTGRHEHHRAQLLFAVSGLMTVTADVGTWVIPEAHALWIPPRLPHLVAMHGPVAMCSAYLDMEAITDLPSDARVIEVSPLLASVLAALAEEPLLYDVAGRGGHLAALLLDEIRRAREAPLTLPLPTNHRLRKACLRLIEEPSADLDLDAWADHVGVSRRTFTRGFREETGMSFGDWRARARVVRALTLEAEGRSARQIANAVGYRSLQALRTRMDRILRGADVP